jgi:hypothetical protein
MLFGYVIAYMDGMGWGGWSERQHKAWSCLGFAWMEGVLTGLVNLGWVVGWHGLWLVWLTWQRFALRIMDMDIGYRIKEQLSVFIGVVIQRNWGLSACHSTLPRYVIVMLLWSILKH